MFGPSFKFLLPFFLCLNMYLFGMELYPCVSSYLK